MHGDEKVFRGAEGGGVEEVAAAHEHVGGRGFKTGRRFRRDVVCLAQMSQSGGSADARSRESARRLVCGGGGAAGAVKKSRGDLGEGRGRLISVLDRREMMNLIEEAVRAGACKARSCEVLGISVRTLQRWHHRPEDGRPHGHSAGACP